MNKFVTAAAAALVLAGPALAQELPSGFSADIGAKHVSIDGDGESYVLARIGYDFGSSFGIQGDLGDGFGDYTIHGYMMTGNAKIGAFIGFDDEDTIGVEAMADLSDAVMLEGYYATNDFVDTLALGGEYAFSPTLAVTASIARIDAGANDYSQYQIGADYYFDQVPVVLIGSVGQSDGETMFSIGGRFEFSRNRTTTSARDRLFGLGW